MKRALIILLVCSAQVASAAPHTVLVLRAEGTADATSRTSVDAHVLRLAKNIEGKVDPGDVTLTEAGAMVGCEPSESACKTQVLDTLGVDELIATTVTSTPTGLTVTVRRIAKVGPPKTAQTTIPTGKPPDAKLNADVGPMFGVVGAPTGEPPPTEPATTPAQPVAPATNPAPEQNQVTAAPNGQVPQDPYADTPPRRRWQKVCMGIGGGFVLLGILMWAGAADVQGQIDDKPEPVSPADFQALQDLERKGDDIAGAGNLFFVVGAGLAGVGAYYYWKAGRASGTQSARIAPMAVPSGAGVSLTLGMP